MKTLRFLPIVLAFGAISASAAGFGGGDLVRQGRMVYDSAFSKEEQDRIKPLVARALDNVAAFYGERKADVPDVYVCKSADCAAYLGGSAWQSFTERKGARRRADGGHWFDRPSIVVTTLARSPTATDDSLVIALTHELAHIETYHRTGKALLPAWFDEGLATLAAGANCTPDMRGVGELGKLVTLDQWQQQTHPASGMSRQTHCQAGMEVLAWAEKNGGLAALMRLLQDSQKGGLKARYGDFLLPAAPLSEPAPGQEHDD